MEKLGTRATALCLFSEKATVPSPMPPSSMDLAVSRILISRIRRRNLARETGPSPMPIIRPFPTANSSSGNMVHMARLTAPSSSVGYRGVATSRTRSLATGGAEATSSASIASSSSMLLVRSSLPGDGRCSRLSQKSISMGSMSISSVIVGSRPRGLMEANSSRSMMTKSSS